MRGLFFLLLAAPLFACGDDDGGKTTPDAKVFMDAAIDAPPACAVEASLGQITIGSNQMRRSGDWFEMPTMGPRAGRTVFFVIGAAATSTPAAIDAVIVEYVKPTSGGFVTGSPIEFITDPTSTTHGAVAFVFGNLNAQVDPPTIEQFYFASNGSLTLQNIGEDNGSMINGSVSQTNFRQIDGQTGADVVGGCTTTLPGMTFALTQASSAATGKSLDHDALLPQATIDAMIGHVQRFKSQRALE